MRLTKAVSMLLLVAAAGCGSVSCTMERNADIVEYAVMGCDGGVRVWLTAQGAARVDLVARTRKDQTTRVFLLPTCADDVKRFAAAIDGLIDSAGAARADGSLPRPAAMTGMFLRCRRRGRDRAVQVSPREVDRSLVWQGAAEEARMLGLVELTRAIVRRGAAERHIEQQNQDAALILYASALKSYASWAKASHERYGGAIWEPGASMEFRYPDSRDKRLTHVVQGVPADVMALEGITKKWALELLRYGWREYTGDMQLTRSGEAIVVYFEDDRCEGTLGGGQPLPPKVIDALKRVPEW